MSYCNICTVQAMVSQVGYCQLQGPVLAEADQLIGKKEYKHVCHISQGDMIRLIEAQIDEIAAFMTFDHSSHLFTKKSKEKHGRTCCKRTLFKISHVVQAHIYQTDDTTQYQTAVNPNQDLLVNEQFLNI